MAAARGAVCAPTLSGAAPARRGAGRLAMFAFMGFVFAAQTTGKNPIEALQAHMADPFVQNWTHNIGKCVLEPSVTVGGVVIPTPCLWPGQ